MRNPRATAWAAATFVAVGGAGEWLRHQDARINLAEQREAALRSARAASDRVEVELARALSATYALAAMVRLHPEHDDFDRLAAAMLPIYGGVSNLQLAPGGVVRRIYPLAGNEGALGHDLLGDPARRAEAEAAIASRQLTLAGPFPLKQGGGLGMVGRYPVFQEQGGEERFWGFVIALIHLQRLLESSQLDRLASEGYRWELLRAVPGEAGLRRFAGSEAAAGADPVEVSVRGPQARWVLRAAPATGWGDPRRDAAGHALVALVAAALAAAAYRLALQPEALRREVAARTAELREAYRRLEEDAARRLRAEEQLREAQKLEAVGQLAGGVAHDFNNLLTGIVACADELAVGLAPGSPADEPVQTIRQAARRAAELTQQLLGFARRGKNRSLPVDLHQLVTEVLRLLARTVDKGIVLSPRLEAEEARVLGDPGQLQQAVLNLAVNARDAMPSGGQMAFESRVEEVGAGQVPPGVDARAGRYLALTVADTGPGIPAALHDRVFEPFFTTKAPGRGTGMGLAMVYGIARNHGGWVSLDSQPGEGARFTLHLPLLDGAGTGPAPEPSHAPAVAGAGRVLLVDDDPVARRAAERMLRRIGYEPVAVASGAEALAHLRQNPGAARLALLDLSMPGMDGGETWRALRLLDPGLRGVLTSGYGNDGRVQAALGDGMRHFLPKPYEASDLARALADAAGDGVD